MQIFKKIIGEGSIGRVHLGRWKETDVAIKVLNSLSLISLTTTPNNNAGEAAMQPTSSFRQTDSFHAEHEITMRTLEREVQALHFLSYMSPIILFY